MIQPPTDKEMTEAIQKKKRVDSNLNLNPSHPTSTARSSRQTRLSDEALIAIDATAPLPTHCAPEPSVVPVIPARDPDADKASKCVRNG
jgi:hypothetical protein